MEHLGYLVNIQRILIHIYIYTRYIMIFIYMLYAFVHMFFKGRYIMVPMITYVNTRCFSESNDFQRGFCAVHPLDPNRCSYRSTFWSSEGFLCILSWLVMEKWWFFLGFNGIYMVIYMGYPLAGGWALPLWKMMEFVSWDYEITNIWRNKKCSKPPTSIWYQHVL